MSSLSLPISGENLMLLPSRALFWPDQEMLIFSDVHLGKAESYRAEGLNIPVESGASDLHRLEQLIAETNPHQIYILGDFIHHRKSWTHELMNELSKFLKAHQQISWNLILGNHERGSLSYLQQLPFRLLHEDIVVGPFLLCHGHQTSQRKDVFPISGHVHPVMTLKEGPLKMRCPCFVLSQGGLILPSFGTWTGGAEISPSSKLRCFAIAGQEIFEVNHHRREGKEPIWK